MAWFITAEPRGSAHSLTHWLSVNSLYTGGREERKQLHPPGNALQQAGLSQRGREPWVCGLAGTSK